NFDTGTTIDLLLKAQRLIHELADELGVRLLMGSQGRAVFSEARALGYGSADLAGLVLPLEQQAGVEVKRP
ncbi:MAG: 2-hydroxy-3-oxopropionate reductase, partial [Chloroflexota bacterium]